MSKKFLPIFPALLRLYYLGDDKRYCVSYLSVKRQEPLEGNLFFLPCCAPGIFLANFRTHKANEIYLLERREKESEVLNESRRFVSNFSCTAVQTVSKFMSSTCFQLNDFPFNVFPMWGISDSQNIGGLYLISSHSFDDDVNSTSFRSKHDFFPFEKTVGKHFLVKNLHEGRKSVTKSDEKLI